MTDIHNAPNGQLAKLQDDFLKLSEINRLLAGAIEVNSLVVIKITRGDPTICLFGDTFMKSSYIDILWLNSLSFFYVKRLYQIVPKS